MSHARWLLRTLRARYRRKTGRNNRRNFVRGSNCPTHSFVSTDGKPHAVKCMDLKGIFRIIQSIPSKKAEPFKRWLAQVGAERIHQMQDPELGIQQSLQDYKRLGYSDNWINQRLKRSRFAKT